MTDLQFLFADHNSPFAVAMVITLIIAAIELVSMLVGLGLSDLIDSMLPDLDPGLDVDLDPGLDVDVDLDADAGVEGLDGSDSGLFAEGLSWLNVGRVPFLVLLIAFLTLFAVSGFVLQLVAAAVIVPLPVFVAVPVALFAAVPMTRGASRGLGRIVPREETYAVGQGQFIGLVADVTLGPIAARRPGRGKVVDQHGNSHNVRIRSANAGEHFQVGDQVLLVARDKGLFDVVAPPESLGRG